MRPHLPVTTDPAGLPCASVPFSFMWDLVEHLSVQRVAVSYLYEATHFTVTFTRIDLASAQEVLNSWAKVMIPDRQVA